MDDAQHLNQEVKSHRDLFQESFNTPITSFLGAYAAVEERSKVVCGY